MYDHRYDDGTSFTGFSAVEQQNALLGGVKPSNSISIADKMESGGRQIEDILNRMNCRYQNLFFISSWGIVYSSVVSLFVALLNFRLPHLIDAVFLLIFGFIMTVLDIPGSPRWASRYRQCIRKYIKLFTRLTGKSLWFLYLGTVVSVSLWPNRTDSNWAIYSTAIGTSIFVIITSFIGLMISFRKSVRLERMRKLLQLTYKGNSPEVYRKYAITDPTHGLQFEEFNRMCSDHTQGKLQFDLGDLGLIYNALDEHQKHAINEREFVEWMAGPMTYL